LKRRAARHGRSAEAEHREILRQALAQEEDPSFEEAGGGITQADQSPQADTLGSVASPGARGAMNTLVIDASIAVKWVV
jgi:plasmid stability protein